MNSRDFMSSQIVHDDDVAWTKRGHEMEPDPAQEEFAVDSPIDDQRRCQARRPQCREERGRLPVTVRYARKQSLAFGRPPSRTGHVRFRPRFIDEDKSVGIQLRLLSLEFLPPLGDVRPLPFRGDEDFFLTVRRSLCSAVHSV